MKELSNKRLSRLMVLAACSIVCTIYSAIMLVFMEWVDISIFVALSMIAAMTFAIVANREMRKYCNELDGVNTNAGNDI